MSETKLCPRLLAGEDERPAYSYNFPESSGAVTGELNHAVHNLYHQGLTETDLCCNVCHFDKLLDPKIHQNFKTFSTNYTV